MKTIPLEEAKIHLGALFDEVISGAVIHVKAPNGQEVQLTSVNKIPSEQKISANELAAAYDDDAEWARFENNCGKASD